MTQQRIARLAPERPPETTPEPAYVLRGLGLFELRGDEILDSYQGGGRWLVPSGSDPGRRYEVRVGSRPKRDRCECRGFGTAGHCSHVVAASRVAKASALCDCCGDRRWQHDLIEVGEDDGLLSWFAGDRLCSACVRAGQWA